MAVAFTQDQQRVIDTRNKNILVSAAAGSGKTAVLVERIIRRILDKEHPIDIDRLLVVTFTNAAAAGMKEKISNAIQSKLLEEPDNAHLQRQAVLVHQAQITTIHSFCLYLIRNHFEQIELEPDFTVADEAVIKLLAAEVKDALLEEAFATGEQSFLDMVEFICHNGREQLLEEYIEQLYTRAMSMPFPKSWLLERKNDYAARNLEDFTRTEAGSYLLLHIKDLLQSYITAYEQLYNVAVQPDGPYMYADTLEKEREYLMRAAAQESLDGLGQLLPNMPFDRLPAKKDDTVHAGKKEWVKERRTAYKKAIQELGLQFFGKSPQSFAVESEACGRAVNALIDLTISYMERLDAVKRKRGLIDFHDMEHMALQILLKETEHGYEPTETALSYRAFFEEVMVDEYQDSNMVQEYLVAAVSDTAKSNRFMVGDVKQSIYKFRLARPEIFMEKYHTYAKEAATENVRIDLKQNFRSRKEVLDATNSVFRSVMKPELGGIAYDENAALYPGASYPQTLDMGAELIIAVKDCPPQYNYKEWEAYCTAKRIKELLQHGTQITDETGKALRPLQYKDIVLLFRSPATYEEAYKKVFAEQGIPIFMTSGSGYFDAVEVQSLVKLLQTIENPRMDIPLFGTCISVFGGINEEQLAAVKVYDRKVHQLDQEKPARKEHCLYDMLCRYAADMPDSEAGRAIQLFLERLTKYRRQMHYFTVAELLYEILRDYHYREYVSVLPDGEKRLANVSLLLERAAAFGTTGSHGVFAFTSYVDQLHKQAVDYGEAGLTEQTAAVHVMSIHKSKGLEFPVTFVCGMGHTYQMRDKQQMLLIDNDMGIGMDYVNPLLRSKNKTLRKNIIALKMEQEILAEEQRILYVAMTRAKEKLIMVGYKAEYTVDEDNDWKQEQNCSLPEILSARSYLELCLLAQRADSPIKVKVMTQEEYAAQEIQEVLSLRERKERLLDSLQIQTDATYKEASLYQLYQERFSYCYPYEHLKGLYAKTSVSELKRAAIRETEEPVFESFEKEQEQELVPYIPAFLQEKEELKGAERGTAYHRVLELLDFTAVPESYEAWQQALAQMTASGRLTERQKNCIYIKKMQDLMHSSLGKRMCHAAKQGSLYKEQSFFLGVTADTIDARFPADEMMLVQGIIDAYFEEDGQLVLVDYKTDLVTSADVLTARYGVQMKYYAKALEQSLGKRVKEVALYSLHLGEAVAVCLN